MKHPNKINICLSYIKDRSLCILFVFLTMIVFSSVYFVYDIELEAILYAVFLMMLVLIVLIIVDFYHYYEKHFVLSQLKETIHFIDDFQLKKNSLHDKDYQLLIDCLRKQNIEHVAHIEKLSKDMEDYFTLWAHQMKLPIAAMKLLLETEKVPDKKLLQSELLRINQYSDMVLAYLRMKNSENDYVFGYYPLDDMIRQAIRKFSGEFIRKKIKVEFQETNQTVLTDEKWLTFVLEQIISNALKYTNKGSLFIYSTQHHQLIIEDTGIGIDSADLPRVFEKGYTGLNGRIDKKATGIGLYLCKNIMEKLSHEIEIQSQINQGTQVILHLDHYDLDVE